VKQILGLDLGKARTGVALSDELRMLAHPLETIESGSAETVARRVQRIVAERNVDCVVVGLPRQMNGALGLAAENAQHFIEKLRPLVSCEVVTWDERLSTVAAERALREAGKKLASELSSGRPTGPLRYRVIAASELLNQQLGAVTHVEQNGGYIIRGEGCPLSALTGKHPAVCRAMESLVKEFVGASVHECCERAQRPRCCFEIKSKAPD